jgi:ParB-like chromosome segregation protein Spo0J
MADGSQINGVHPFAALFPMLDDEGLDELAADIKANGLNHPLLIDADGLLIDGRNRREACHRIEITPDVELFEGDAVARILSENVRRRHMNKGQQAMAVAMAYPEPKRGQHAELNSSTGLGFDKAYLSNARLVGKWTPEAAAAVLAGVRPLADAHAAAIRVRDFTESAEGRMERLKAEARDLAEQVEEERLTLGEALAALEAREAERKQLEEAAKSGSKQCATNHARAFGLLDLRHRDDPAAAAKSAVEKMQAYGNVPDGFEEACRDAGDYLLAMAATLGERADGDDGHAGVAGQGAEAG